MYIPRLHWEYTLIVLARLCKFLVDLGWRSRSQNDLKNYFTRLQDYKIYFVSMSHNLHHKHYDEENVSVMGTPDERSTPGSMPTHLKPAKSRLK